VQFEFAGVLGVAPGRYLAREDGEDGQKSVLVVETLGAPAAAGRRRRQAREVDPEAPLPDLPLTRATAIRAFAPFDSAEEAAAWLDRVMASEEEVEAVVEEGGALLNRALHAQAAASADPYGHELAPSQALQVLVGVGSGEQVAAGRFSQAREVDVRGTTSRRQRREAELRPQERVAAVLGGRERIDPCEILLLRARADLDAGRLREAALQLRVGLEALLTELAGALADPSHEEDMAELEARRQEAVAAANMALRGDLNAEREDNVRELIQLCERVLRRRRVLRG
jgi:hypothetical protein